MGANTIKLKTICGTLGWILFVEVLAWLITRGILHNASIAIIGIARIIQILGMLFIIFRYEGDLGAIGAARSNWMAGLQRGAFWSAGFALAAGIGIGLGFLLGYNPLFWIRAPLPRELSSLIIFILIGGLIAPVAEELCFRGILYTYFRKWGILCAVSVSTVIFVVLHCVHGIPIVQIIGGLVFAVAFEISGNLLVPVTIHVSGNLAIFALSLPIAPL
jgi:membrane protease YdiL (CAAX protease family)